MSLFLSFCVSMIKDHHYTVLDKQNTITTARDGFLSLIPYCTSHIAAVISVLKDGLTRIGTSGLKDLINLRSVK